MTQVPPICFVPRWIQTRMLYVVPWILSRAAIRANGAMGQKQTCAPQKVMSALPPKATLNAFSPTSALGQKRTFGHSSH